MADSFVRVPADDAGKRVDASSLDVGLNTVYRQRMVIGDDSSTAGFAVVTGGALTITGNVNVSATATVAFANPPTINNVSATVQVAIGTPFTINAISATVTVAGNVNISATANVVLGAGAANIGTINNISATVAAVLGAGTANIGSLNNISATVVVAGVVALTAGTANIGFLDSISRTVQVAVATPFTINNISASVVVATGAVADFNTSADVTQNLPLIGLAVAAAGGAVAADATNPLSVKVERVSATASVILAAGTANFGTLNDISRTVQVAIGTPFTINAVSATVTVAGNVNISATAVITGVVNISATANVSAVIRTSGGTAVEDTTNNALRVNVVAGSAGGPSVVDNATFTLGAGASSLTPIGALRDDTSPSSASEGAAAILRMTEFRALHTSLRLSTGTAMEDTANTALRVNVVAGGGAGGGTSMADRGTFTPGTTAITPAGGTFNSGAAALSEGEAAAVRLTGTRGMWTNLRDSAGAELGIAAAPLHVNVHAISATASVILAAGTANIGTLNNVSATVIVAGVVALTTGAAVIGDINAISRTVQVAVGTPFTVNNISATVVVSGLVGLTAGTAVIGDLNAISRTVQVAIGTPFTINNVSASVVIATGATADFNTLASADQVQNLPLFGLCLPAAGGASVAATNANPLWVNLNTVSQTYAVVLAAGAANIGDVNAISRTVQVAVGTPFTVNNISATVIVAGVVNISLTANVVVGAGTSNIGFINNISATVTVAGNVNISATPSVILAAGTANFGTLNGISATVTIAGNVNISATAVVTGVVNVSATATVAVVRQYASLTVQSASRGPRMGLASTSANVTLVTAPGAGMAIYVTHVAVSNASGSNTRARIGTSASIGTITMMMAASGGGFTMPLTPPWKLSTNEALLVSVKPNASEGIFNCNFFVASADAF